MNFSNCCKLQICYLHQTCWSCLSWERKVKVWGRTTFLLFCNKFTILLTPHQNGNYPIFTARKRSLGQGNVFTRVCHSILHDDTSSLAAWSQVPSGGSVFGPMFLLRGRGVSLSGPMFLRRGGGSSPWTETPPTPVTIRILLEYILVGSFNQATYLCFHQFCIFYFLLCSPLTRKCHHLWCGLPLDQRS